MKLSLKINLAYFQKQRVTKSLFLQGTVETFTLEWLQTYAESYMYFVLNIF